MPTGTPRRAAISAHGSASISYITNTTRVFLVNRLNGESAMLPAALVERDRRRLCDGGLVTVTIDMGLSDRRHSSILEKAISLPSDHRQWSSAPLNDRALVPVPSSPTTSDRTARRVARAS